MNARMTIAAATLALLSGCAFDSGEPYGYVNASFTAHYELLEERDVGEPTWQKLVSELHVVLEDATITVDVVELVDETLTSTPTANTGGGNVTFDPANPPPGYSLCHNGHCHHDSGDLVDYEDIVAELQGGGATTSSTVALSLDGSTQDLLRDEAVALTCEDCQLSEGYVSLVRMRASRLELRGRFRDGLTPPRFEGTRRFEATVELGADDRLEQRVALPLDDDNPSGITMALHISPTAAMLDSVDPMAVASAPDGPLSLDDTFFTEEGTHLHEAFAELTLDITISRNDL